ncbi:MAG: peptide chain release factor 1 [Thermaerobacter sp.]|nr:peptide chain release factor 1 [Thermaerobacter sp.]
MDERLEALVRQFEELQLELADPELWKDPSRAADLRRRQGEIEPAAERARELEKARAELRDLQQLAQSDDEDLCKLAAEEQTGLEERIASLDAEITDLLSPRDPRDDKDVIVEVRAGAGGDEAALFAGELLRMYGRYAERHNWQVEMIDESPTTIGGFKEVIFAVKGRGAYSRLRFESGVHRVQRVPETEAQGRIHTSTITVAVLPETEDVELHIDPQELRIDTYRSGGAGGQHVNKTESAVRITHLPTGIVVICQDEKSQHKNRDKAMRVLRARLMERLQSEAHAELAQERRAQVGTGDRSERVRTYNFPQGRVTDHRIGFTTHRLGEILDGDLDELFDALRRELR